MVANLGHVIELVLQSQHMTVAQTVDTVTIQSVAHRICMKAGSWAAVHQTSIPYSAHHSPSKQPLEQQVLGPHNAMNRLVWCVTDGTDGVGFGSLLRPALKALGLAADVHRCLHACKAGWPHIMYNSNLCNLARKHQYILLQTSDVCS